MFKFQLITILMLITPIMASAEAYKWVDDKGKVHFSDKASDVPASAKKETIKIQSTQSKSKAVENKVRATSAYPRTNYGAKPMTRQEYQARVNAKNKQMLAQMENAEEKLQRQAIMQNRIYQQAEAQRKQSLDNALAANDKSGCQYINATTGICAPPALTQKEINLRMAACKRNSGTECSKEDIVRKKDIQDYDNSLIGKRQNAQGRANNKRQAAQQRAATQAQAEQSNQ